MLERQLDSKNERLKFSLKNSCFVLWRTRGFREYSGTIQDIRTPPLSRAYRMQNPKIYLVEDNYDILCFLQQALLQRPWWHLVGHSPTLKHALKHAPESGANIFLIDLGLPDGMGEELLETLREHVNAAELLVFTVFGDEARFISALEKGATGYVLKGCSPDELIGYIQEVMDGGAPMTPTLARLVLNRFRGQKPLMASLPQENVISVRHICGSDAIESLSGQEESVLKKIAGGYSNPEIAELLGISPNSVKTVISRIYKKLSINSRAEAISLAIRMGVRADMRPKD